jgi:hypothetical protein
MANRRSLARVGARIVVGLVGIAVAGGAIIAATILPLPTVTSTVPSATIAPIPAGQQRVCPGPLLDLAADSADPNSASAFGAATTVAATSDGTSSLTGLKPAGAGSQFGGPSVINVPAPSGSAAPLVAGAQVQNAQVEDLTGLAAASCNESTADSWLVAGSTDVGQTSLILLSNPTKVQASVNLTIYGESGKVSAPGARGILVDPGTQKIVPLSGIAPDVKAPVVHVQSTGGQVLATMQQSVVRGITPGGAELAGATAAPATKLTIPGVVVQTLSAITAAGSAEGSSDLAPALRVLVPGDKSASVSVGIQGEQGTEGGSTANATIQPGTVQEIPLDRVVDGTFTITVTSTRPVVVAARTSTTSAAGSDFAWFNAAGPLAESTMVAAPQGPGATLHLANQGTTDASVTVEGSAGSPQQVSIPAGQAAGVPLSGGSYTVSGHEGLFASVGYAGDGALSSFTIAPPGALAAPITVFPR